jgi:hypothetical protein
LVLGAPTDRQWQPAKVRDAKLLAAGVLLLAIHLAAIGVSPLPRS